MGKRKPKLSPAQIAHIGLQAIKAHDEETRQIGKEARAIIEREQAELQQKRQEQIAASIVTAAQVRRFQNDNEIVGSNTLMASDIVGTLENCACVAEFLWFYQGLDQPSMMEDRARSGLSLVTQMLMDALSRQLDALQPESRQ